MGLDSVHAIYPIWVPTAPFRSQQDQKVRAKAPLRLELCSIHVSYTCIWCCSLQSDGADLGDEERWIFVQVRDCGRHVDAMAFSRGCCSPGMENPLAVLSLFPALISKYD